MKRTMVVAVALAAVVAGGTSACEKGGGSGKATANAALKVFPKDIVAVAGINWAKVRTSVLWKRYEPQILGGGGDDEGKEQLDLLKKKCGFDVIKDVSSVVIGFNDSLDSDDVIVVVSGNFDEKKAEKCFNVMMEKEGHKGTVTKEGNITDYAQDKEGEVEHNYVAWIDSGTVLLSPEALKDKDRLKTILEGKSSAKDDADLAAMIAKADTGATAWGAVSARGEKAQNMFESLGEGAKGAWGSVQYQRDLKLTVGVRFGDAKAAKGTADKIKQGLEDAKQDRRMGEMIKAVKVNISQSGNDVVVTLEVGEKKIEELMGAAGGLMRKLQRSTRDMDEDE